MARGWFVSSALFHSLCTWSDLLDREAQTSRLLTAAQQLPLHIITAHSRHTTEQDGGRNGNRNRKWYISILLHCSNGLLKTIRRCRTSVPSAENFPPPQNPPPPPPTFEMKQHVRLVILKHLRHELGVHVLRVDILPQRQPSSIHTQFICTYVKRFIQDHHSLIEFLLPHPPPVSTTSLSIQGLYVTHDIRDDACQQLA